LRYEVVKMIKDRDAENHQNIKFLMAIGDGTLEELISYNELSDLCERQAEEELNDDQRYYAFDDEIDGHQGPMNQYDKQYRGSSYNLFVKWTNGEETWEPLAMMIKYDALSVAVYGQQHGLLDNDGWKRLKKFTKRQKHLIVKSERPSNMPSTMPSDTSSVLRCRGTGTTHSV
jgi:hypothetical protein